jgi:hypothetical protein
MVQLYSKNNHLGLFNVLKEIANTKVGGDFAGFVESKRILFYDFYFMRIIGGFLYMYYF